MINDEFSIGMIVHHKGDAHLCLGRVEKLSHMEHVKMAMFIRMHVYVF